MTFILPEFKHPFSLWIQISSFSFLMAGNFSDLLIVRMCLSSAYVFAFINHVMGAPLWPALRHPGYIQLDGLFWATLNLYVHVSTVVRMFNDEKHVQLDDDMMALWRMFFRTGGLSKLLFQEHIGQFCTVVRLEKSQPIDTEHYFYIIYKGTVKLTVRDQRSTAVLSSRHAQSGQLFDFRHLNLLQESTGLARSHLEAVVAASDVVLFRFPRELMPTIAGNPRTRLMWKELLMESMLRIVQRYFDARVRYAPNTEYVNPIFDPLQEWEMAHPMRAGSGEALRNPLRHVFTSAFWSFAPPWPWKGPPLGLRHTELLTPTFTPDQTAPVSTTRPDKKTIPSSSLASSETDKLLPASWEGNGGEDSTGATVTSYSSSLSLSPSSPSTTTAAAAATTTTAAILNRNHITSSYRGFRSIEDEDFFDCLYEIDEEMGGIDELGFKPAITWKKKVLKQTT